MNGLFIAASGAATQLDSLDTLTNNLANSNTVGYRRIESAIAATTGSQKSPWEYAAEIGGGPYIDMSQGPVQNTGNPLDVAVIGNGFIRVQTDDGEAYTRNGQLQVSPDGNLLAAGQPVMNAGGELIALPPGTPQIATNGMVSINGQPQGQISIADPTGVDLIPQGDSLYRASDGTPLPESSGGTDLRAGFVEEPRGSAVVGMVSLLGTMRNYESAMKTIQTIDQSQQRTIQSFDLQA